MRKLLAVALLALTACGQGAAPRARPVQEIDGTTAHAVAKAGVLRKADLPGYRALPGDDDDGGAGSCLSQGPRPVAEEVASYRRGLVLVASAAGVAPNRAAIDEYVTFLRGEFAECFERALMAILATEDFSVTGYRSKPARVRVPGSDAAYGWDVRLTAHRDGRKAAIGARVVSATTGHAALVVFTFGPPGAVPSVARLAALTSTAARRAGAAAR